MKIGFLSNYIYVFTIFKVANEVGVRYVSSVMGILQLLDAKLPDGYRTWDEAQWRAEVAVLLPKACFYALNSPTVKRIREVLSFFVPPNWENLPARKYQSCIIFILWKLRCHIVHHGVTDPVFVTFREMQVRVTVVNTRRVLIMDQTVVAWGSQNAEHSYFSFAANEASADLRNNLARLKLEANADNTGVHARLDPGSTKAACQAMQELGAYFSTVY